MNIYIWDTSTTDGMTADYHSEGGAVVIAESEEEALFLLNKYRREKEFLSDSFEEITNLPSRVINILTPAEKVFLFPNAGCC